MVEAFFTQVEASQKLGRKVAPIQIYLMSQRVQKEL